MSMTLNLELIEASTPIEFLKIFLNSRRGVKKMSYRQFSKKAGYSSKSYISEILSGKKPLTRYSAENFLRSMNLNKDLSTYFRNLVSIELVESEQLTALNKSLLISQNEKLKFKLKSKLIDKRSSSKDKVANILLKNNFPTIFAALGSAESGASIDEIAGRSNLTVQDIKVVLLDMVQIDMVNVINDRYYAKNNLVDLDYLKSDQYFIENFIRCSARAQDRLKKKSNNKNSLFMTQTFSAPSGRMQELKDRLKAIIIDFADDTEDSVGDSVLEICISFTSTK